jgi:two-component system LytT family response regulator
MIPTIRALIVDDEKPARERLRRLLTRDGRTELAGSCAGGAEAVEMVQSAARSGTPIHVMFLDVQMPELDGFGVLAALVNDPAGVPIPEIVFVTAHDVYALRAFDAQAIAYLLKPYSDEKFQATLDHALRHVRGRHADAVVSQMQALLDDPGRQATGSAPLTASAARPRRAVDRIVVRGSDRVRLLPVEQISWIEADGMYVKLHTRDGATHLHRALLGSLDDALDARRFVRIHRSAIVNIDVVVELRQDAHGEYIAVLRDQTEIRVGRRFRARLQARLGQQL